MSAAASAPGLVLARARLGIAGVAVAHVANDIDDQRYALATAWWSARVAWINVKLLADDLPGDTSRDVMDEAVGLLPAAEAMVQRVREACMLAEATVGTLDELHHRGAAIYESERLMSLGWAADRALEARLQTQSVADAARMDRIEALATFPAFRGALDALDALARSMPLGSTRTRILDACGSIERPRWIGGFSVLRLGLARASRSLDSKAVDYAAIVGEVEAVLAALDTVESELTASTAIASAA